MQIYPLSAPHLTPEQIAVAFAKASRSPDTFAANAAMVSADAAGEFHARYTIGYGHASVAEHAVIHLAIEDISRLAADALEDNRLASYTEQSSRYQRFHQLRLAVPEILKPEPELARQAQDAFRKLHENYAYIYDRLQPRLGRPALDVARGVLPAATLTNVGLTCNARVAAHIAAQLAAHPLPECRSLGRGIKNAALAATPTLVRYAEPTGWLSDTHPTPNPPLPAGRRTDCELLDYAPADPVAHVARLRQFRDQSGENAPDAAVIQQMLAGFGPHDAAPREFETVTLRYRLVMDYGALREYRRHRMQTLIAPPLSVRRGCVEPPELDADPPAQNAFRECVQASETLHAAIMEKLGVYAAQYAVLHAHRQHLKVQLNLRELYHVARLRLSPAAHPGIRTPVRAMVEQARALMPALLAGVPPPPTETHLLQE